MRIRRTLTVAATATLLAAASMLAATAPADAGPADDRAYVSVQGDETVKVYDTTDNSLITTISSVDFAEVSGLAVSPDGSEVYLTDPSAEVIFVIDTATNTIDDTITGSNFFPIDVVFSPDGSTAYVGYDNSTGRIDKIDTTTRAVIGSTDTGKNVTDLVITPDGSAVYNLSEFDQAVVAVDTATMSTAATFTDFSAPLAMAAHPVSGDVYVTDFERSTVTVFDTTTHTVDSTFAVTEPRAIAFSPDGSTTYLTRGPSDTGILDVLDTTTRAVIDTGTDDALRRANSIAISSDGATLYATSAVHNHVAVVDTATLNVTDTFAAGTGAPYEIALGPVSVPEADLGVSLDANAPALGSRIDYALTLTNNGPDNTTAATVQVSLPSATTSVTNLPTGCTYASGTDTVTCTVGAIANGGDTTRAFRANLGLLSLGPLPATATRTTSTPTDPNPTNDTSNASCTALTSLIITC